MARTLVASDSFTYSDGDLISVSGGNWENLDTDWNPPNVATNIIVANALGSEGVVRWSGAGTFSNDQYSSLLIAAAGLNFEGASRQVGVLVRASAPGTPASRDYYAFYVQDDASGDPGTRTTVLAKIVNGTETVIHSAGVSWGTGMRIELEVEGTTLRGMKDGVALGGSFTATDSDLASGKPGVYMQGAGSMPKADSWEGGDITGGDPEGRLVGGKLLGGGLLAGVLVN